MVVPHVDEGPVCSSVLNIRIPQVRAIHGTIVFQRRWDVKVSNLLAMWIADDVSDTAVIHPLGTVLRGPYDFIDEVAEVQHEANPLGLGSSCVFENHSAVGVLRALVRILATHKNKTNGSRIAHVRRCETRSFCFCELPECE